MDALRSGNQFPVTFGLQSAAETMTANIATRENYGSKLQEELLPGILDDIVFTKIVPKLQWKDLYILSIVNRAWYNANRSRRVFDSRVLSRSLEILVPVYYHRHTIALYSMRENSWYKLPPITDASGGRHAIPALGRYESMNGKIYILGGVVDSEVTDKVFVFDLAGKGHWKECASMKQRRKHFGSAVIGGKIYVFGGVTESTRCNLLRPCSEVYEPKEDTWSPIKRMTICRFRHHVIVVGEEVFIYGGYTSGTSDTVYAVEAYHPVRDEWRVVQRSWNQPEYGVVNFSVQGSVFSIQGDNTPGKSRFKSLAIYKHDLHRNSSIQVHSFALAPVEHASVGFLKVILILPVDDELIAIASCYARTLEGTWGLSTFQSAGFGSENRKISWKLGATSFSGSPLDFRSNFFGLML